MALHGKVIVVGPANVGKTCLLERFVRDIFAGDNMSHGPTLGCDCLTKTLAVDSTEITLYMYDTAGQERFADMAATYYRLGDVCLLCFDMANLASFDHIKWWQKRVAELNPKCSFVLVGTKMDLIGPDMDIGFIEKFAEDSGMPFFATSAKDPHQRTQIGLLFHSVAEKCLRQAMNRQLEMANNIKLQTSIGAGALETAPRRRCNCGL